ncbi:hypothetical protein Taro_024301 [Colocasia esculenta]|uniref:Uncharacterized protein n=1 Tax=Colocasia esculenta TaxID=4460 RepID=A0A843V6F8_COLES|nr:hypothetical protein [Colocasia esculenta]
MRQTAKSRQRCMCLTPDKAVLTERIVVRTNPCLTDVQVEKEWEKSFATWLRYRVEQGFINDLRVQEISYEPSKIVRVYPGYIVNGYRFHTRYYGWNKSMMNSGVCVKGSAYNENKVDYYGILEEVIELQFFGTRQPCISLQVSLDNKEEEVDPNALDNHVVEREVESNEEEEWTDDEDKEDDKDDAKLDISLASDDEYR